MWVWLFVTATSALNCTAPSKKVLVPATAYYCNNAQVRPEDYEANQGNPNCYAREFGEYVCVCPEDYYGSNCESLRPLVCNLTITEPNGSQCTSPKGYNTKLPGLPSCFQVPLSATVSLKVLPSCYTLNPAVTISNVPAELKLDLSQAVAKAQFSYLFNQSGVSNKQLVLSLDPQISLNFTFLNFYYPRNRTYTYSTVTSPLQLTGSSSLLLSQPLVADPLLSIGGRIHYEINLYSASARPVLCRAYLAAIDVEGYEEPERRKAVPVGLIVGVIVGVLG